LKKLRRVQIFLVVALEVDQDHIHGLVKSEPRISPLAIVRRLKQESPIELWQRYEKELKKHFWKERTLWSEGYFCCTIGNASQETIRQYIESQG
jgi:REP-associated tyrosine transposase